MSAAKRAAGINDISKRATPAPGRAAAKKVVAEKAVAKKAVAKKAVAKTTAKAVTKKQAIAKAVAKVAAPAKAARVRQMSSEEARATYARLHAAYPDAHCELDHGSPFTLLVATVLSAQTTDVLVNKITPHLFARWPDAPSLAKAQVADVAALLAERGMGMYNQKAKNIVGLAKKLMEEHGGEVPRTLAQLVELPGVGRKTANVVLGVAFGAPEGVVVDTHVQRLTQRLGWSRHNDPAKIEPDLCKLFPREDWDMISHVLIFHGRRTCFARKPACAACPINDACPSAFRAENIGRKPKRIRA